MKAKDFAAAEDASNSQDQKPPIIGQIRQALSSGPEGFSVTISAIAERAQEGISKLDQAGREYLDKLSGTVLPKVQAKLGVGRSKSAGSVSSVLRRADTGELDTGFFVAPPLPPVQTSDGSVQKVLFNGVQLDSDQLLEVGRITGKQFSDGAYWYDEVSGAWGLERKGPFGKMPAGLKLGGILREDASAGTTGVFMNGRQLGLWELVRLRMVWSFPGGRYYMDAEGNFGMEGGPVIGNLRKMALKKVAVIGALVLAQAVVRNATAHPANNNSGTSPRKGIPGGILSTYDKCGCVVVGSGS